MDFKHTGASQWLRYETDLRNARPSFPSLNLLLWHWLASDAESSGFALEFQTCLFLHNRSHLMSLDIFVKLPICNFALQLPFAVDWISLYCTDFHPKDSRCKKASFFGKIIHDHSQRRSFCMVLLNDNRSLNLPFFFRIPPSFSRLHRIWWEHR